VDAFDHGSLKEEAIPAQNLGPADRRDPVRQPEANQRARPVAPVRCAERPSHDLAKFAKVVKEAAAMPLQGRISVGEVTPSAPDVDMDLAMWAMAREIALEDWTGLRPRSSRHCS